MTRKQMKRIIEEQQAHILILEEIVAGHLIKSSKDGLALAKMMKRLHDMPLEVKE